MSRSIFKMLPVFILFYIFLHTTESAIDYGEDQDDGPEYQYEKPTKHRYDQILSNLHDLFEEKTHDNYVDTRSRADENNFDTIRQNKEFDKEKVDEVLGEVTSALDKIKTDLLRFNSDGILTVEVPIMKNERRYRRDINVETVNTTAEENTTVTAEPTTAKAEIVTEKLEPVTEKIEVKPETLRVKNETDNVNGRRMLPEITTTSRVKDKLLSYLEDTFNEVERKIKPLTNIKIALSNDDHYRIGYIIATIDTLEVNLKKLRNDMNLHQHYWDDEKILDLFDRIKATNSVASSLIESLKKYLPKY